jgi:hypothetical protein
MENHFGLKQGVNYLIAAQKEIIILVVTVMNYHVNNLLN